MFFYLEWSIIFVCPPNKVGSFYGMWSLVGLFYAKVSLMIVVSTYIHYKNVSCPPLLGYFMPNSV